MPKLKLTKSAIEALLPAEKGQVMYVDTDLPGFYLIVGRRAKTFAAQKDIQGRSVRYSIGKYGHFTVEEARKIAREKLYLMSVGVNPNTQDKEARARAITLEMVLESYIFTRRDLKPRTKADYRYILNRYMVDWKRRVITDIDKDMVAARHTKIATENGASTANKVMRVLRAILNYAYATFDIERVNPVAYLTQVKAWYKEKRRRTYIKPSELKAWWDAVYRLENDTYRDFFLLLLFTGLRRGEAASLRWSNVNFEDRVLSIEDTKNGDPLTLPLGNFLHGLLEARRRRYGNYEYIFPGPGAFGYLVEPKKGINKVIKASGISFSCHDLRRTFITIAESLDISAYALKRLVNHRVTDVTGGYIIVDVERLRKPVAVIERFILERVHGDEKTRDGSFNT